MRVASMPMYDLLEVRPLLDALWAALARNLRREGVADVPGGLVYGRGHDEMLSDPDLLFTQCCGFDIVNRYRGVLVPIATPHYGAPGCDGSHYTSAVIVAEDSPFTDVLEMHGKVCAINGHESHSGMNALRALVAPESREGRFFSAVRVSGAHAESLGMVRRGTADVAAIDCVTYALLASYRPAAVAGTRMLGQTYGAPGLPYVTRADIGSDTIRRIRRALFATFADADLAEVRFNLYLKDVEELPLSAYDTIAEFEAAAAQNGYPVLR